MPKKKEKRELVLYAVEAKQYIETLPGKKPGELAGKDSKDKMHNALADFMLILSKHGRTLPEPSDYEEYREGKPDNKTTKQNENRIKSFFVWLEQQRRENVDVAEEYVQQDLFGKSGAGIEKPETLGAVEGETAQSIEETSQAVDDGASTENSQASEAETITENEPESWPESEAITATPVKARKSRAKGEKKVPVSVYLRPETYERLKILTNTTHESIGETLSGLADDFADANADNIAEIQRALQAVQSVKVRRIRYD